MNSELWAALAAAIVMSAFFGVARVRYLGIPKLRGGAGDQVPNCMVLIPARNEESLIGRAVRSLPHDSVIVVDDHSEDGTAEVARKAGAGVLPAPELPRSAIGKANACLAGARILTSKWILFADADTCFEAGFLGAAVACAEASELALVSFYLRPEFANFASAALGPYARALFFCGVSPGAEPESIFNGQCILARRDAYEFIGGHAAVLNTLTDDLKLAALARRHRLRFGSARAEDWGQVRWQETGQTVRRGAFRFLALSSWMGIAIVAAAVSAAAWLPILVWLLLARDRAAAAAFAILPMALLAPWAGNLWRAILAPAAIYAILPSIAGGLTGALGGRKAAWKGREI